LRVHTTNDNAGLSSCITRKTTRCTDAAIGVDIKSQPDIFSADTSPIHPKMNRYRIATASI